MDDSETVLIIGASRGIGRALARQFAEHGFQVHATVRSVADSNLADEFPQGITLHQLDVRNSEQIESLRLAFEGHALDVLIHNAGIMSKGSRRYTREEVMAVNAAAPMSIAQALLDAVARSKHGRIVLVSSQLGARQGRSAGLGDYGDSKAALNDALRAAAPDWAKRGVTGIVVHPGWVRTDMGGPSASISVDESAAGLYRLAVNLQRSQSGQFLTWRGERHPW